MIRKTLAIVYATGLVFLGLSHSNLAQTASTANNGSGTIHILSLTSNGVPVSLSSRTITVQRGAKINASVTLRTNNLRQPGDVAPFGYTWTWGNRSSSFQLINGWIPSGIQEWIVPIELMAPTTTGTYKIFFGFNGEFTLSQVFSNHNWQAGEVLWGDGNDYWDITDSKRLTFIGANGYLPNWFYRAAIEDPTFDGYPLYGGWAIPVNYLNVRVTL